MLSWYSVSSIIWQFCLVCLHVRTYFRKLLLYSVSMPALKWHLILAVSPPHHAEHTQSRLEVLYLLKDCSLGLGSCCPFSPYNPWDILKHILGLQSQEGFVSLDKSGICSKHLYLTKWCFKQNVVQVSKEYFYRELLLSLAIKASGPFSFLGLLLPLFED